MERGLSLDSVGAACGVDRWKVSRWERGEARIPMECLPALTKVLAVTVDDLFPANARPLVRPLVQAA